LLEAAARPDAPDPHLLDFACALARQCFINEYVFSSSEAEIERARALRDSLAGDGRVSPLALATVAAYFPLRSLSIADALPAQEWPPAVVALLRQQLDAPRRELELAAEIPAITPIDDEISRQVQRQYEENPYPRWVRIGPITPAADIDGHLHASFPLASFANLAAAEPLEILIAGCGTGQQVLEIAQRFPRARVLALDLSRSSLAYAKRKAEEAGVGNVEFAQADILHTGSLGRSFDVIYAGGVLHHLREPERGWRELLGILRPNGFMHVALYSEAARRGFVAAQQFVRERGLPPTPDGIRAFRRAILAEDPASPLREVSQVADFYSMSECRDLVFHVQEHRFTPAMIGDFLAGHGLKLLGFELDPPIRARYRREFPDDPAAIDLGHWQSFEEKYPETFLSMYQFWLQKPAAGAG
jgi:SAM-dependent methyltransferase